MGLIYSATFPNGKQYVGQTIKSLNERIATHKYWALNEKDNFLFHKKIRQYGFENIKWEILEDNIASIQDLNDAEIKWIEKMHTYVLDSNNNGYNLTKGGDNYDHALLFNQDQVKEIVNKYKNTKVSMKALAKEYNCSISAIKYALTHNLPDYQNYSCYLSLDKKEEIYNYYKITGSIQRLCNNFNISSSTAYRALKAIDPDYKKYQWPLYKIKKEDAELIYQDFLKSRRIRIVCNKWNLTKITIYNILNVINPNYRELIHVGGYSKEEIEYLTKENYIQYLN